MVVRYWVKDRVVRLLFLCAIWTRTFLWIVFLKVFSLFLWFVLSWYSFIVEPLLLNLDHSVESWSQGLAFGLGHVNLTILAPIKSLSNSKYDSVFGLKVFISLFIDNNTSAICLESRSYFLLNYSASCFSLSCFYLRSFAS